ncbi:hypothetical protein F9856_04055 [Streptococcus suis]|nr:hypothetical protein [Streptococcus suis]
MECETRTNLPINHCAEMLTRTLRSEAGLSAQPLYSPTQLCGGGLTTHRTLRVTNFCPTPLLFY